MAQNNKINTHDSINTPQVSPSDVTGTTVGTKRGLDVYDLATASILANQIDAGNSTTTPLGAGATFTGTAVDVSGFAAVSIQIYSDQDSATDGMQFQFSIDGTNWDDINEFSLITAESNARRFQFPVTAQYFRFVYTNGGTAQGAFRVQTILHRTNILTSIHRIDGELVNDRSVTVVKSVISGETSAGGGGFVNVKVDPAGKLETNAETTQSPVTRASYNVSIAVADTEQSLVLPTDITGYMIKTRGAGVLKLSHVSGESGTNYTLIPGRANFTDDHRYQNLTIYFQSPTAGEVVEVVAWELI